MVGLMAKAARRTAAVLAATAALALACVLTSGCSQADQQVQKGLPEWTDEAAVTAQAHEVVDEFNARDYGALAARYQDEAVTADQLQQNLATTQDEYGALVAYGDASFLQGESLGRSYATVIQKADYEGGAAEFRISFFEDGSLAGFYFLKADGQDGQSSGK